MKKNTVEEVANIANMIAIRNHFIMLINGMGDGFTREQLKPVQLKVKQLDKLIVEGFLTLSLVEEMPVIPMPVPTTSTDKKSRVVRRED